MACQIRLAPSLSLYSMERSTRRTPNQIALRSFRHSILRQRYSRRPMTTMLPRRNEKDLLPLLFPIRPSYHHHLFRHNSARASNRKTWGTTPCPTSAALS